MPINLEPFDPFMSPMERVQRTLEDIRPRLPFDAPRPLRIEPLHPFGPYDSLRNNDNGTLSTTDPLGHTTGRMFRNDAGRPGTYIEMNQGEIMTHGRRALEMRLTAPPAIRPLDPLPPRDRCVHGKYGYCAKCSRDW